MECSSKKYGYFTEAWNQKEPLYPDRSTPKHTGQMFVIFLLELKRNAYLIDWLIYLLNTFLWILILSKVPVLEIKQRNKEIVSVPVKLIFWVGIDKERIKEICIILDGTNKGGWDF